MEDRKKTIEEGRGVLGIELGSTRIKAVLIDEKHRPIASGEHEWESRLEDGIWTYTLEDIWSGIRDSYGKLADSVRTQYGVELRKAAAMGISAMMHGYLVFNKEGNLMVPFRTWRNGNTGPAAETLTKLFHYNIPQRWSIAHLYQAILNQEEHVKEAAYLTTLSGYIHWKLTGEKVLGIGDASGMFPIDTDKGDYREDMIEAFENLVAEGKYPWKLRALLPRVLKAGENAGRLTEKGAALLDERGSLEPGILMCPPEGDAGTGMAATNSVTKRTGNVSAGTSVFAMAVLEKEMQKVHPEIDLVTTPDGSPTAMVHANNCTSDLNAWVEIFREFTREIGAEMDRGQLFSLLYNKALEGDPDCGGLLSYGYLSGENITGIKKGHPLFVRGAKSRFTLGNFMRVHLFSALGALKVGMDILMKEEKVSIDMMYGHGGFFKTKGVGQRIMAAAINAPVSVMETAGEGGPWGMALLAAYEVYKKEGQSLGEYLKEVFGENPGTLLEPDPRDVEGFEAFTERYKEGISIERAAMDCLG